MFGCIRPTLIAALTLILNAVLTSASGVPAAAVDTGAPLFAAISDSMSQLPMGLPARSSTSLLDTTKKPGSQKPAPGLAAAAVAAAADTFRAGSGGVIGVGIGLSLGNMSVFPLWEDGLPKTLIDLRLNDSSFAVPDDTSRLAYALRQSPDIYNMMFPIRVFYGRLFPDHRLTASLSFAALSKEYDARLSMINPVDSLRYLDIRQTLDLYSFTARLTWGVRIPERYFSVDNIDRTDALIGISASPWVSLRRSSTIGAPPASDSRLQELYSSILPQIGSFSAKGMAIGWHAGIATIHHSSAHSGIEAEITYSGLWYTRFRTGSGTLTEGALARSSINPGKTVSSYSNRIEISISVIRKIF